MRQLPRQQFVNHIKPVEFVSEDELEAIHTASLRVLSEHGVEFVLPEAREILKAGGADVRPGESMVRFDPQVIEEHIKLAPSSFRLFGRSPAYDLDIGGNHICFGTVSSTPNVTTLEGRRSGTMDDFCRFLKLSQRVNVAHNIAGHVVEPVDVPVPLRHLRTAHATLTMTEMSFRVFSLSRQRVLDVLEMSRLARGQTVEQMREAPGVFTSINPNSPRQYDEAMLWGMIECARVGQPVFVMPFALAGAMAPASLAGAMTLQNAEALAGIAFTQMVAPGTPVIYGGFISNMDMKSGSPAFGTPEAVKTTLIGGQLARRYGLPYRASGANASNVVDAQAIYESQMSLWASILGGANYVYHALGWLEGGLASSFEKFIIDAEMIQALTQVMQPVLINAEELAVEAIGSVPPAGHFLESPHTLDRYQDAFYTPFLSDWRNYEAWEAAGAATTNERAARIAEELIDGYEQPAMKPEDRAALDEFVARRVEQGGAPVQ